MASDMAIKYFLFLDESGDHGLGNIDYSFPVFVLCGVLISDNAYQNMGSHILKLKKYFWNDKKVIFHSRDIRKCEGEFSLFFDLSLKEEFYRQLNAILMDSDYTVISSAIEKNNFLKQYGKLSNDVYEIALSFIVERAVFFLDAIHQPIKLHVIIERRGRLEDKKLEEHFQRLCANGTYYVNADRLKQYGLEISFKNKKDDIQGLQVADLVAYPTARYVIDPNRANPAFDIIKEKIYKNKKNNKLFGLKIFP